jgi:ABC-2 type transport system ATP-binding protein
MTHPQLLLLDEPSSGLDLDQQLETQRIIQTMGKTSMVILSSHSQTEIKAVCHQIIGIEAGRLSKPQSIQAWISQTEDLR